MTHHKHSIEHEVTEEAGEATEPARREAAEEEPASPAGLGTQPGEDDPDTKDALSAPDDDGEGEVRAF